MSTLTPPGVVTAPITTSALAIWASIVAGSDCSTRALLPQPPSAGTTR
jgi:hypothetical protein